MNKEKYALFTGCVIPVQLPFLEKIARVILPKLGIEITDLDFTCCPFYAVKDNDEEKWLLGAARNLALAEKEGINILSLCNGCSQTLIEANHELKKDKEKLAKINENLKKIGLEYKGKIKTKHFMMLFDEKKEEIKKLVKNPLNISVATHTGCHLLRPADIINYDDAEDPKKFDELIRILGGKDIDYQTKTLCCGNTVMTKEKEMSLAMMKDKLDELNEIKPDAFTVCCPSCFLQYDKNQVLLKSMSSTKYDVPVIHILQLMALAFGMTTDEAFLKENRSAKGFSL